MAMGFADAIQTLRGMFAHIPEETLAVVLESHSGHMERTVEYLLAMGVDERPTSNVAPDAIGESDFTEALTATEAALHSDTPREERDELLARMLQGQQLRSHLQSDEQFNNMIGRQRHASTQARPDLPRQPDNTISLSSLLGGSDGRAPAATPGATDSVYGYLASLGRTVGETLGLVDATTATASARPVFVLAPIHGGLARLR